MTSASRYLLFGSAFLMLSGGGAMAQPAHRANMTCSEYLQLDDVTKPKVVFWAEGLSKSGKPEDAVIDVESVDRIVPVLTEKCTRNPNASFWGSLRDSQKGASQ